MIGSLLSMKLIGHKTWVQSFIFWAVLLAIGVVVLSAISVALQVAYLSIILSAGVFLLLAHYWYKLPWRTAIIVYVVGLFIDIIIIFTILFILGIDLSFLVGLGGFV